MKLSELKAKNTAVQVCGSGGVIQFEEVVRHHYAPGVYVRELEVPKGLILIGRIHKFAHVFLLTKGSALMWVSDAKVVVPIKAPFITSINSNTQKAFKTLSDCILVTSHSTSDFEDELLHATNDEAVKNIFTTNGMLVADGILKLTNRKELKWLDQC